MEVEPVTATDSKVCKWADQRLDATLGTRPTTSVVTRGNGTSQIDQSLWENLTKVMGSSMGQMLQTKQIQHQTTATHYNFQWWQHKWTQMTKKSVS